MPRRRYKDITGKRYGKLVAIEFAGLTKTKQALWLCKCDCGNHSTVMIGNLTSGMSKSCGCGIVDRLRITIKNNTKHGNSKTKLYRVWTNMKSRCLNSKSPDFKNYGGRGITICSEWTEYIPFRDWALANGYSEGLEIDREDNDGNYEPSNCRFVTRIVNQNNRVHWRHK